MVKVRVWDLPTRLGHWLLATSFVVAWVTAEREAWRLIHVKAGYVMLAVIAFRAAWGVVGTRHARFVAFAFSPRAALAYVAAALRGTPQHYPGHNPAGGWSIFALLTLALCACVSGIADYEDWGPRYVGDAHEALSIALLVMIGIHLAGRCGGQSPAPRKSGRRDDHRRQACFTRAGDSDGVGALRNLAARRLRRRRLACEVASRPPARRRQAWHCHASAASVPNACERRPLPGTRRAGRVRLGTVRSLARNRTSGTPRRLYRRTFAHCNGSGSAARESPVRGSGLTFKRSGCSMVARPLPLHRQTVRDVLPIACAITCAERECVNPGAERRQHHPEALRNRFTTLGTIFVRRIQTEDIVVRPYHHEQGTLGTHDRRAVVEYDRNPIEGRLQISRNGCYPVAATQDAARNPGNALPVVGFSVGGIIATRLHPEIISDRERRCIFAPGLGNRE